MKLFTHSSLNFDTQEMSILRNADGILTDLTIKVSNEDFERNAKVLKQAYEIIDKTANMISEELDGCTILRRTKKDIVRIFDSLYISIENILDSEESDGLSKENYSFLNDVINNIQHISDHLEDLGLK